LSSLSSRPLSLAFGKSTEHVCVVNADAQPTEDASPDPDLTTSPAVLSLKEIGKTQKEWALTLHPTHLALAESPDERPYVILREQLMKTATLVEGMRTFAVEQPRKILFKLDPAGAVMLADWMGKPFLATFYLKRRYMFVLPWAFLGVLGSLVSLVPRPNGISTPFDLTTFVMSLALITAWAFAKYRPHPILFLVDSAWFTWVAVNLTIRVMHGQSKGWLLLVALLAWAAVNGLKHFIRFQGTRITVNSGN
jgi:hypothetical protein